jgi:hypothetical protein
MGRPYVSVRPRFISEQLNINSEGMEVHIEIAEEFNFAHSNTCLHRTVKRDSSSKYGAKAKALPLHATWRFGGEEVYLLFILDLGTRWG